MFFIQLIKMSSSGTNNKNLPEVFKYFKLIKLYCKI